MSDEMWRVTLEIPGETRFLHIVRLAAAGAAAEAGLDAAETEDVKIAVDELCSLAIDAAADGAVDDAPPGSLSFEFSAGQGGLSVEVSAPAARSEVIIDELAEAILDATVDSYAFDPDTLGGGFRLTKSHRGP